MFSGRSRSSNSHSTSELGSGEHDIKKPSLKGGSEMFGGGLPPLSGPGAAGGGAEDGVSPAGTDPTAVQLTQTKVEKHDYKYNITGEKYGVDPAELGGVQTDHLVLPAAPLGKLPNPDHYNPDSIAGTVLYIVYK